MKIVLTVLAVIIGILAAFAVCLLAVPFNLRTKAWVNSGEVSEKLFPERILGNSSGKLELKWLFVSIFLTVSKGTGAEAGFSLFGKNFPIGMKGRKKDGTGEKKKGKKKKERTPFSLSSFCDSMKQAGNRIREFWKLIRSEETGLALKQCKKSFHQAMKAFDGDGFVLTGKAGLADPAETGALAAGLSVLCPWAERLDVEPYFGEADSEKCAVCDLEFSWDTRITTWFLLTAALGIVFNPSCRKVFGQLKQMRGDTDGKS